ncbi:MAG TPA: diacylglycerol kinase family protein [Longimicrobiales bacterium]|nr:diacylglycerol kinase family protein [Longimicrobiales bacterium]
MEASDPFAAGPYADRILVLLNPNAGQEDPVRLRRELGGAFAARHASVDLVETQYAGHATELAWRAAELGYRAVCAVGGDGTLAEVASGLAGTQVPMALIPRGTGNQVAHNLLIPDDLEGAVRVAVQGVAQPMDLGQIGDRSFALVAGAGYDAAVMTAATRPMKERWGFAAYVFAAVKEALAAQPVRFRVTADDNPPIEVDAVTVLIANMGELFTAFLPGLSVPLAPAPTDSWHDGLLEVLIVAPRGVHDVPNLVWRAATRRFAGDQRLVHLQARRVMVESDPPIATQVDGDPAGTTPLIATTFPGGVRIMMPE